jgi:hypothetical protein
MGITAGGGNCHKNIHSEKEKIMSFLGLIANPWAVWIFFILAIVGVCVTIALAFSDDMKFIAIATGIVTVLLVIGWVYSVGHRLVPINSSALIVDKTTSTVVGDLRPAGITTKPFWSGAMVTFPANPLYEWCPDFTPSTVGTYEVKVTVCFYIDASKVDWKGQYLSRRGGTDVIFPAIQNTMAQKVASVIKNYKPLELTTKRDQVSDDLFNMALNSLKDEGIPLVRVSLKNWDFTNPNVRAAFDEAVISQTLVDKAQADLAAAEVEREAQQYRANTANLISSDLAAGYSKACQTLGISQEDLMLNCVSTLWLAGLKNPPANLVVGVGSSPSVAIPAYVPTQAQAATPEPTPTN